MDTVFVAVIDDTMHLLIIDFPAFADFQIRSR
jgi:hypothetical protein